MFQPFKKCFFLFVQQEKCFFSGLAEMESAEQVIISRLNVFSMAEGLIRGSRDP